MLSACDEARGTTLKPELQTDTPNQMLSCLTLLTWNQSKASHLLGISVNSQNADVIHS
jgi:hypothetical protein